MEEQKNFVEIVSWPKEEARLEHDFKGTTPCPVSIAFEKTSANVVIQTTPDEPFNVDMNMHVSVKDQLPVCIRLCEPICAKSDYTVGIEVFDRPVVSVTVRGMTRVFNCRNEHQTQLICTSFKNLKDHMDFKDKLSIESLLFSPESDSLHTVSFGKPEGQVKLAFPPAGVRVDFPYPVSFIELHVGNYAGEDIHFIVLSEETITQEFTEQIIVSTKEVHINQPNTTAVSVKGGKNEAYLAEICYR